MKIYIKLFSAMIVTSMVLVGCKPPSLKSANYFFDNQFYMELDGTPVVPAARYDMPVEFVLTADSILLIKVVQSGEQNIENKTHFRMLMEIKSYTGPGTYPVRHPNDSSSEPGAVIFYQEGSYSGNPVWYGQEGAENFIRILELDSVHRHISGIFRFILSDGIERKRVDNGFWDWNYIQIYY